MDDELKAQVAEFYRRALAEGASEEQAVRLSRRFMAEQRAAGGPSIGPAGPMAQPAFPKLSPVAGGALDMLIQFGLQGTTGGAVGALFPSVAAQSREIQARNPRTSMLMKGAGAAMALPMAAAGATVGAAGTSLAATIARQKLAQAVVGGGVGAGLFQWLRSRGQ